MSTQRLTGRQSSGGAGGSLEGFTHVQGLPSNTWTCVHNLGRKPAGITVLDSTGQPWFYNEREDPSDNVTILKFGNATFGGEAYFI